MPGLTRTAVRTRTREMLAEPTERYFTDCAINTWIDDGVRDVSIKTFCNTKIVLTGITTVVGCANYTWPVQMDTSAIATIGIKTIITSNDVSLDYVSPEQLGRVAGVGIQNMRWTSWNEQVYFSHSPTAILTLIPMIWVEGRQTASGSINLPNAYHHVVSYYCIYMGHMKRLELDAAQAWYGMYQQELDRIVSLINTQYVPNPKKQGVHDQGETP